MKRNATEQNRNQRPHWNSLDQLSSLWGLSRARTNLVVQALIRSGRMEVRKRREDAPPHREFRIVSR